VRRIGESGFEDSNLFANSNFNTRVGSKRNFLGPFRRFRSLHYN
jgi:hypothetical protein